MRVANLAANWPVSNPTLESGISLVIMVRYQVCLIQESTVGKDKNGIREQPM